MKIKSGKQPASTGREGGECLGVGVRPEVLGGPSGRNMTKFANPPFADFILIYLFFISDERSPVQGNISDLFLYDKK